MNLNENKSRFVCIDFLGRIGYNHKNPLSPVFSYNLPLSGFCLLKYIIARNEWNQVVVVCRRPSRPAVIKRSSDFGNKSIEESNNPFFKKQKANKMLLCDPPFLLIFVSLYLSGVMFGTNLFFAYANDTQTEKQKWLISPLSLPPPAPFPKFTCPARDQLVFLFSLISVHDFFPACYLLIDVSYKPLLDSDL